MLKKRLKNPVPSRRVSSKIQYSPDFKFDDPKLILEIEPGLLFSIYGRDGFVAVRFSRHRLLMSIWGVLFCFNRTLFLSVELKKRFTGSSSGGAITK